MIMLVIVGICPQESNSQRVRQKKLYRIHFFCFWMDFVKTISSEKLFGWLFHRISCFNKVCLILPRLIFFEKKIYRWMTRCLCQSVETRNMMKLFKHDVQTKITQLVNVLYAEIKEVVVMNLKMSKAWISFRG